MLTRELAASADRFVWAATPHLMTAIATSGS